MTACEGVGTGISALLRPYLLHPKYIYIAYSLIQNLKVNSALCYIIWYIKNWVKNDRKMLEFDALLLLSPRQ